MGSRGAKVVRWGAPGGAEIWREAGGVLDVV